MAYSVTPLVITGDSWTAGNQNTYVRDNFKAGIPDIFTAAGDIAYGMWENTVGVLPIGTARKRLMINDAGTLMEWRGIIGCRISNSAISRFYNAPPTKITFDTEHYDTNNFWSVGDPDAITIPFNGVYHISGCLITKAESIGLYDIRLYIGPSDKMILRWKTPETTNQYIPYNYVGYFSAGEDVYLKAGAILSGQAALYTYHSVRYLGTYS